MTEHAAENGVWLHCQWHWLKYRLSFVKSYLAMNNQFFLLSNDRIQANFPMKTKKNVRRDREIEEQTTDSSQNITSLQSILECVEWTCLSIVRIDLFFFQRCLFLSRLSRWILNNNSASHFIWLSKDMLAVDAYYAYHMRCSHHRLIDTNELINWFQNGWRSKKNVAHKQIDWFILIWWQMGQMQHFVMRLID